MIVYADTSALVKYYVKEKGTEAVVRLIDEAEIVGFASITYVEIASALSKAAKMHWISSTDSNTAWEGFLSRWPSYARISLTTRLIERAGNLAREFGLRAYDAIHLSAALIWKETLDLNIKMATFDRELWQCAKEVYLGVWPTDLDSFV